MQIRREPRSAGRLQAARSGFRRMKGSFVQAGALGGCHLFLLLCLCRGPASAPSDVCSQKSAVKGFDERGGKWEGEEEEEEEEEGQQENPSSSPTSPVFSLGCHSSHPSLRPSLPPLSLSPPFIYCLFRLLAVTLISPRLLSRLPLAPRN